jgi:hypothetical protein
VWKPVMSNVTYPTHCKQAKGLWWHKREADCRWKSKDVLGIQLKFQDSLDDWSDTVEKLFRLPA